MLKIAKAALVAIAIGLTGCATVSQEKAAQIESLKRSSGGFTLIAEGRIVSTHIGKAPAEVATAKDTVGLATKSTTIRGASLVLGALEILENNKDLFHIRYKEEGSDEEKLVLSQYVPQRPDQWKTGMLFRYFETRDGYHFLRGFNNEADFQVFNQ